ncbi:M61 family metallopeptidase [Sphingopyxis flava]|uniref:Glycyl aminopeptidase. Metallo peptidase. MEROPS family M61 n=1 Tax=Sphingopyxis flava TaxID=1507287 RepID=A0A1T5AT64_9SPHN|nr:M61 family metallopeptidase [Sphingopyxis flava]SKB37980.1 glycyl aminopeptidase. Metallo peptidase. MEROPS family M61 [Sphingopyxis flava]
MKKAPFVAVALLAAPLALVSATYAQDANSRPQPAVSPHAIPLPADRPYPGTIGLKVDATDVARGIFRVRQTIPVAKSGKLTLLYPKWLPGKHAPRGAIAEVAGFRPSAGGKALAWTRQPTDVYAFDIDVPEGVKSIELAFDFLSPTRTSEGRVVVTPSIINLQWEQVSLYPAGYFTRNIPVQLDVTLPEGWTGAAALDGLKVSGNRYSYAPTSYETLIDSPMFAGRYFRKWKLGHNVTLNVVADEAQYLEASPDQIATHAALVSEALALFGIRHFDRYEFLLALTDELGGIGLEHHRSSENSSKPDYFTKWSDGEVLRGLLPHEFTHSWNGKYRRPAKLWTPDYRTPMEGNLLWVYEGQTSFWDIVLAARSGMQSKDMALAQWATTAANYSAMPGRSWRSVEDTTLDPVIAARKPKPFASWSRGEDYYNEGSLVWLDADMLIRTATNNKKSLDDFAKSFFGGREGDWGEVTYEFDDVVRALNAIHPHDWATFLRQRLQTPGQPAPAGGIERAGYKLVWRDTPNAYDKARMAMSKSYDLTHSLGLTIDKDDIAGGILWDGPAFRADIVNGTKIVAVDGVAYSRERLETAIKAAADGKTPVRLLVERGGRYRDVSIDYHGGLRWPWLERTSTGPDWFDRLFAAKRSL